MLDSDSGPLLAADAVLALLKIDEPTHEQHAGALLVGTALIHMSKL